ncbi:MAG: hypothetical protein Q4C10_07435 [Clostridia bacterium]|nr:hypothetical protein [Clostridia bacterium]
MELIALILIIVFIAASGGKGKKNRQNAARRQPQVNRRQPSPSAEIREMLNQFAANRQEEAQPSVAVPRAAETVLAGPAGEGESALMDEDCRGGSMPHTHEEGVSALADEDCQGGSMAHSHTEGVGRASQTRRMAKLDEAGHGPAEPMEHRPVLAAADIDAQAMRRAVVMAEVLGKPRALARRR